MAAVPDWYLAHRIHAHTRLSITEFCSEDEAGQWSCKSIFDHAASMLAVLGAPAYVRHTHTADEGV